MNLASPITSELQPSRVKCENLSLSYHFLLTVEQNLTMMMMMMKSEWEWGQVRSLVSAYIHFIYWPHHHQDDFHDGEVLVMIILIFGPCLYLLV